MKTTMKTVMQRVIYIPIIISSVTFSALSYAEDSFAEDFSLKTNDELFDMREQTRTMDESARNAYRTERQSRMMNMDQTQRDARFADMGASGRKNMENSGQHNGSRKRDGSGGGQQRGKGRGGQGNSSGEGNQYRYGQSSESGGGRRGGGGRYGSGR